MSNNDNASNGNDNGHSATDIITYIGVPLAVLGVLPILYNTVATLVHASKIKRMLRHARLTALTRSDVVNRVIEIELPRYAVTPLDRFQQRHDYWSLSLNPSSLPGGSWTTFHWKTNTIGVKTQRVEYADQLRQPQADVAFDELVAYLLDLGAVPDAHGWRLLRTTGLWTPVGCALMRAPAAATAALAQAQAQAQAFSTQNNDLLTDDPENAGGLLASSTASNVALAIAPLDDADGNLSLAVTWRPQWTQRSYTDLPPYWVNLPAPPPRKDDDETKEEASDAKAATDTNEEKNEKDDRPATAESTVSATAKAAAAVAAATAASATVASRPISCHFSADGLVTALTQTPQQQRRPTGFPVTGAAAHQVSSSLVHLDGLAIGHLQTPRRSHMMTGSGLGPRGGVAPGVWFASAATAFGTTSQTMLWNYQIPEDVLQFARRDTVPCGALVLLDMVDESETPTWATETEQQVKDVELQRFISRTQETRAAELAERLLPPAQRAAAQQARRQRESMAQLQDMQKRMHELKLRRETRELEALHSPKWDARLVAEYALRWLQQQGHIASIDTTATTEPANDNNAKAAAAAPVSAHLRQQAGHVLHRMVRDPAYTAALCSVLDCWKAWADRGGMQREDLAAVGKQPVRFAEAVLLMALIRDTATAVEGTLAADLQECLRMWRKVRLG